MEHDNPADEARMVLMREEWRGRPARSYDREHERGKNLVSLRCHVLLIYKGNKLNIHALITQYGSQQDISGQSIS